MELVGAALLVCGSWLGAQSPQSRTVLADGRTIERGPIESEESRETWRLLDSEGRPLVEGELTAGLPSGSWRFRGPDQRVRVRGRYRAGRRHGTWTVLDAQGKTLVEGAYEEGLRSGAWRHREEPALCGRFRPIASAHADGTRFEGSMLGDLRHGRWRSWWPDGTVQLEAHFAFGRPVGTWRFQHADGAHDPALFACVPSASEASPGDAYAALLAEVGAVEALLDLDARLATRGSTRGSAPSAYALPREAEWTPAQERALRAALVGLAAGERSAAAVVEELFLPLGERRHHALPTVLEGLWELELESEAGALSATRVLPLLGHLRMFWLIEWNPSAAGASANRLELRRLQSFLALTRALEVVWQLDLEAVASPGQAALARRLVLCPPTAALLSPDLERPLSPCYAARAAPRERGAGAGEALTRALAWLVAHQSPGGGWDADGFTASCGRVGEGTCSGPGDGLHDVGTTALALLALMGDGNLPASGRHAEAVRRGFLWLLSQQEPTTGAVSESLVDHMLATQALAEGAALSSSVSLRDAAERAVRHVEAARNPYSGWRYAFPPAGESDSHVTALAVEALAAAAEAGIAVDPQAAQGALALLEERTDPATRRVGYLEPGGIGARVLQVNDHFPHRYETLTALALACRLILGADAGDPEIAKQAELIGSSLPRWDVEGLAVDEVSWMHVTAALAALGGKHWLRWKKVLEAELLAAQRRDGDLAGSWDPAGTWGSIGGRVVATAACALCLEAESRPLPRWRPTL